MEINHLTDEEIYKLYLKDRENIKDISNERIVKMIQNGYEMMWDVLYKKTENAMHKIFHKKVHEYYKSTMKEDVYSALELGWINAVLKYDEEKATAPFIAYASYLMYQRYVMLVRQIKPDRIGKSVRYEFLENINLESIGINQESQKQKDFAIHNLLEDKKDMFSDKENIILLKQALNALKEEKEYLHQIVVLHYLNGIPQTEIAAMNGYAQSYVSKKIKQGIKFLQDYMLLKSKGDLESLKRDILSSFSK